MTNTTVICLVPYQLRKQVRDIVAKHHPFLEFYTCFTSDLPGFNKLIVPAKISKRQEQQLETFTLGVIAALESQGA